MNFAKWEFLAAFTAISICCRDPIPQHYVFLRVFVLQASLTLALSGVSRDHALQDDVCL